MATTFLLLLTIPNYLAHAQEKFKLQGVGGTATVTKIHYQTLFIRNIHVQTNPSQSLEEKNRSINDGAIQLEECIDP